MDSSITISVEIMDRILSEIRSGLLVKCDIIVLFYIATFCWGKNKTFFKTNEAIAEDLDYHRVTVSKSISKLINLDYLNVVYYFETKSKKIIKYNNNYAVKNYDLYKRYKLKKRELKTNEDFKFIYKSSDRDYLKQRAQNFKAIIDETKVEEPTEPKKKKSNRKKGAKIIKFRPKKK